MFSCLPAPSLGVWSSWKACAHLGQESAPSGAGPGSPCPLCSLKPQITCEVGAVPRSLFISPRCAWQAQPSLMTPCLPACPLCWSRRGGVQPSLSCGFFFHCVRPQGPARLPARRWAGTEGPTLTRPAQLWTSCAPRFGDPEASSRRVSWGWGTCPELGRRAPSPSTHRSL